MCSVHDSGLLKVNRLEDRFIYSTWADNEIYLVFSKVATFTPVLFRCIVFGTMLFLFFAFSCVFLNFTSFEFWYCCTFQSAPLVCELFRIWVGLVLFKIFCAIRDLVGFPGICTFSVFRAFKCFLLWNMSQLHWYWFDSIYIY